MGLATRGVWRASVKAVLLGALVMGGALTAAAAPTGDPAPMDNDSDNGGLEEIIVTAQKRAQSIKDIGVSVTAVDAQALAAIGKSDVMGLVAQVPSLQVNQYSPTITVFNIRGVSQNDFADSQEAPIAFYNDEVYVSALGAISGQMFDLERVEVLRGPQGTLFGRNATGGLVQVVTAKPSKTPEGFLNMTFGSYGQIASEGAISGPLSDTVRARLSFSSDNHDGYIHNQTGPDLGNSKFYAARLQVEADVGDGGDLLIKVEGLRNDHENGSLYSFDVAVPNAQGLGTFVGPNSNAWGTCPGCNILGYKGNSNNPYNGAYNYKGVFDRTFEGVEIHYTRPIGDMTLTSITDYQQLHKSYGEDTDASPLDLFTYRTHQNLSQGSQELRLSGDYGKLTWVGGLYGFYVDTSNNYNVNIDPDFSPSYRYHSRTKTASAAVFGQLEYAIDDEWKAIAGLRFSDDWKTYNFHSVGSDGTSFYFSPETDPKYANEDFANYSGKVEIDYKPDKDQLYYFSVNRGTKAGGYGTPASTVVDPKTMAFGQEVLTSFELGEKVAFLHNTTSVNGALFYYDYHNYQAFSSAGLSQFVTNHDATVHGAELEVTTVPVRGLHLQAFGTYLDTDVQGIVLPDGEVTNRTMPQAPRFAFGGSARYEFDAFGGLVGLQTDWRWDGTYYFAVFNAPVDKETAHAVGNVRVTFTPDASPWDAAFFINNVADRRYRVYDLDVSSLSFTNATYARPRWFGGTIGYKF